MLKTKQHASAKRIVTLLEEPKEVYASLLIAGTLVNICIIVLSNYLINQFISFNKMGAVVEVLSKVIVIAFILVFAGKIFPKVWAAQNNLTVCIWIIFYGGSIASVIKKNQQMDSETGR